MNLDRIFRNSETMEGKPCIPGTRVTVGTIVGLIAAGHSVQEALAAYPCLEEADLRQARYPMPHGGLRYRLSPISISSPTSTPVGSIRWSTESGWKTAWQKYWGPKWTSCPHGR